MFLGVDIGGTFTDLVMLDENGGLVTTKALSTPGELEVGVFNAVEDAARQRGMTGEELLARVVAFGHGTTQATNAVIERDGARTGLVTTRGFGDTLAIQRLMGFTAGVPTDRLGWYSRRRYPQPIVPRHLVRDVRSVGTGHLRVELQSDAGGKISAMAFRVADTALGSFLAASRGNRIHVAGNVQANYWNGSRSVQFRIIDAAQASTV